MNQLATKLKNPFFKEVLLATVLFALPFLMWVHVLFSDETVSIFYVFGFEYNHGYLNDAQFSWTVLVLILPLVYVILFKIKNTHFLAIPIRALSPFVLHYLIEILISGLLVLERPLYLGISIFLAILYFLFFFKFFFSKHFLKEFHVIKISF